ncbi:intracellular sterol transport [Batrachochytrium dendrobatidis]|nr:intracellular sterol transport [Batrachochytrium dendrobatidis]
MSQLSPQDQQHTRQTSSIQLKNSSLEASTTPLNLQSSSTSSSRSLDRLRNALKGFTINNNPDSSISQRARRFSGVANVGRRASESVSNTKVVNIVYPVTDPEGLVSSNTDKDWRNLSESSLSNSTHADGSTTTDTSVKSIPLTKSMAVLFGPIVQSARSSIVKHADKSESIVKSALDHSVQISPKQDSRQNSGKQRMRSQTTVKVSKSQSCIPTQSLISSTLPRYSVESYASPTAETPSLKSKPLNTDIVSDSLALFNATLEIPKLVEPHVSSEPIREGPTSTNGELYNATIESEDDANLAQSYVGRDSQYKVFGLKRDSIKSTDTHLKDRKQFTVWFPEIKNAFDAFINSYSCAWDREMLWQGRIFVTVDSVCFYASLFGQIAKLTLDYIDIQAIEKKNTVGILPNAIRFNMLDNKQYVFTSLLKRDAAFELIESNWIQCTNSFENELPLVYDRSISAMYGDDMRSQPISIPANFPGLSAGLSSLNNSVIGISNFKHSTSALFIPDQVPTIQFPDLQRHALLIHPSNETQMTGLSQSTTSMETSENAVNLDNSTTPVVKMLRSGTACVSSSVSVGITSPHNIGRQRQNTDSLPEQSQFSDTDPVDAETRLTPAFLLVKTQSVTEQLMERMIDVSEPGQGSKKKKEASDPDDKVISKSTLQSVSIAQKNLYECAVCSCESHSGMILCDALVDMNVDDVYAMMFDGVDPVWCNSLIQVFKFDGSSFGEWTCSVYNKSREIMYSLSKHHSFQNTEEYGVACHEIQMVLQSNQHNVYTVESKLTFCGQPKTTINEKTALIVSVTIRVCITRSGPMQSRVLITTAISECARVKLDEDLQALGTWISKRLKKAKQTTVSSLYENYAPRWTLKQPIWKYFTLMIICSIVVIVVAVIYQIQSNNPEQSKHGKQSNQMKSDNLPSQTRSSLASTESETRQTKDSTETLVSVLATQKQVRVAAMQYLVQDITGRLQGMQERVMRLNKKQKTDFRNE